MHERAPVGAPCEQTAAMDGHGCRGENQSQDCAARRGRKVELGDIKRRLHGYLLGVFSDGAPFKILDKYAIQRTFAKRSRTGRTGKPVSVSHIERAITALRKESTVWRFEDIYYRAGARGKTRREMARWRRAQDSFRRHRRIKVSPAGPAHVITPSEVMRRLLSYIVNSVKLSGRAHVDREFLRRFQITSGLPIEWIELAAQRINGVRGCRCRRRGIAGGTKIVVEPRRARGRPGRAGSTAGDGARGRGSLPQIRRGISFSYGEEDQKQPSLRDVISQTRISADGEPSGKGLPEIDSDRSPRGSSPGGIAPPLANHALPRSDGAPPHGNTPAALAAHARTGIPPGERSGDPDLDPPRARRTNEQPFQISGRWISGAKIARLANWLAVGPMRAAHVAADRVTWRFAHAANFARRNLRNGHGAADIVAAYTRGVARSHNDSLDRDRAQLDRDTRREPRREPSAAVVYAAAILGADARTAAQRWAEFFAAPRAAKLAHRTTPRERRAGDAPPTYRATPTHATARQNKVRELRELIGAKEKSAAPIELTIGELRDGLARRGLSMAQFAALGYAHRQQLIARVRAEKK